MLKTREQVREEFNRAGLSIAEWARENGFNPMLVYLVLNGKRQALRGQTNDIAVALSLKEEIISKKPRAAA